MERPSWRAWALAILVTVVVIVSLQNSQQVRVDVLFVTIDAPLIVILLGAVLIGAAIGYIAPVLRQRQRHPTTGAS